MASNSQKEDIIVNDQPGDEAGLTFWGHLEVLRWALVRVAAVVFVAMIAWFILMPDIFRPFVLGPTTSEFFLYRLLGSLGGWIPFLPDFSNDAYHVDIININVASQFMTHITTSFWFALVTAFPYLIYEIWKFISPALYDNEKGSIGLAFFFGTGMFYLGCAVGYSVIFPFTFRFLTEYQLSAEITNQISLNSYMGTFMMMVFVMGLVFEIPLLAWVMSKLGLINKEFLVQYRRHAVAVMLILAAAITPTGDPFTLSIVFIPLYLLYELAIKIVRSGDEIEADEEDDEVEEEEE
jgi:sec-independent protein translocase protein TatC